MRVPIRILAAGAGLLSGCDVLPSGAEPDTTPPQAEITTGYRSHLSRTGEVTAGYLVRDAGGVASVFYRVTTPGTSPEPVVVAESSIPIRRDTLVQGEFTVALPEGNYTLQLIALDVAGNEGQSGLASAGVDVTAPHLAIQAPARDTLVIADTVRVTVESDEHVGFWEYAVNSGEPVVVQTGGSRRTLAIPVAVGSNVIRVTGVDLYGHRSEPVARAVTRHSGAAATFSAISGNSLRGCGLTADGAAFCWTSRTLLPRLPQPLPGNERFRVISHAAEATCGITISDEGRCWGWNRHGALGIGSTDGERHDVPQVVAGDLRFASISGGSTHFCAVTTSGAGYCWGYDFDRDSGAEPSGRCYSQVISSGTLTVPCHPSPALVDGAHQWLQVSSGSDHACGITQGGAGYCWGAQALGSELSFSSSPAPVAGDLLFEQLHASGHVCAVSGGRAYCWGHNSDGQLGDGTTVDRLTPTAVQQGGLSFRSVGTLGSLYSIDSGPMSCGREVDGRIHCWGAGRTTPAPLEGELRFTAVSQSHRCGITNEGLAYCWDRDLRPVPVLAPL